MRGRPIQTGARKLLPTVHPAYLLRLPDRAAKELQMRAFADNLKQAALLSQEGAQTDGDQSLSIQLRGLS